MEIEDIKKLDKDQLRIYNANVMLEYKKENGVSNTEFWNGNYNRWCPVDKPAWYFNNYYYRIIPEKKKAKMTDAECKQFVKDNYNNIIIINKQRVVVQNYYFLMQKIDIADKYRYLFISEIDCNNIDKTPIHNFIKEV